MKNSKLFAEKDLETINYEKFKQLMYTENYIFVDSQAIRNEYTYFVCFQNIPEHDAYFNRPTFMSAANSYRDTI